VVFFDVCCVAHCPITKAMKMGPALNQRVDWKRKKSDEYFRIGMLKPPLPNTRVGDTNNSLACMSRLEQNRIGIAGNQRETAYGFIVFRQ